MNREEIIAAEQKYIVPTYVRPELVLERGEGRYLFDMQGNRYLDFMSGIAVTALGHSDPRWVEAVCDQAGKLAHVSNLFHTAPHVELAKRLVDSSFADRVFFCNSGSEANEAALKFARKYARVGLERGDEKTGIVAFTGSFHGRTMGALATTHNYRYRAPFAPLVPGVRFGEFNGLAAAEALVDGDTCAVIVEPVQGEGGVNPATTEFLQTLRRACDRHDALLIFDEVQCGLGRTGTLWAYEQAGVEPDIMTVAKPLAGGLPIGATLVREEVAQVLGPGDHGSTFAAGPIVCRAGCVVFDRVSDSAFLWAVQEHGDYLLEQLRELDAPQIVDVRGRGLLVGLELDRPVRPFLAAARAYGLLLINAGDTVLRLAPPLTVTRGEIDVAVDTIGRMLLEDARA